MQSTGTLDVQALFCQQKDHLWQMSYRMTGIAADADEIVQETFVRLLQSPPADLERPLRPWLTTIALNLARDRLRRRKGRDNYGPWLPSPVLTERLLGSASLERFDAASLERLDTASLEAAAHPSMQPEQRYSLMESATFAFLLALEALNPTQRAVLLCRDVFDYSSQETAQILGLSDTQVRTTLHRARKTLDLHDRTAFQIDRAKRTQVGEMLLALMAAFQAQDKERLAALLMEDAIAINDGGGVFKSARKTIFGQDRVIRFFFGLMRINPQPESLFIQDVNGLPAILATFSPPTPRTAPHVVWRIEVNSLIRITQLQIILAPQKLSALSFDTADK